MFFIKAFYCRVFQGAFRLAMPLLPYREPEILHSCSDLCVAFKKEQLDSVLVVTDKGIVANGLTKAVEDVLVAHGVKYAVYDGTQPNPTVDNVEEALALYLKNSCRGIIAIGGGSPMDCAKALGARVAYPKKPLSKLKGILKVRRSIPTLIAIPTTAGTGSETTLAAIITDSRHHYKYALMSFPLIPHYAVLDARLTVSLPPSMTSTTGMDALTHAVESYIGRSTTKETKRLALEATRLVFENVETAYSEGDNLKARRNMLHAAFMAGVAFSKSYVGYAHAVAHSLGGMYGTPHGLANAVILPYVLDAYGSCVHKKLHTLGVAAGVCTERDSHAQGAEKFISAVRALNAKMGIPDKISGIKAEDVPLMSKRAEKEANPLYPVPKLMTEKELRRFYCQISE